MAARTTPGLSRIWDRQADRRWRRATQEASTLDAQSLKAMIGQARALRRRLDRALNVAETRVSQIDRDVRAEAPLHSDWAYRPQPWSAPLTMTGAAPVAPGTRFGAELAVFHDCPRQEITVRQVDAPGTGAGPAYDLTLDVLGFEGEFLSFAIDLPAEAVAGLQKRHLIRADLTAKAERPLTLFARLNVVHGPNNEQLLSQIDLSEGTYSLEFDLTYTSVNEGRVERMWLDLIVNAPQMNRVVFHDLVLSRRPRAEL